MLHWLLISWIWMDQQQLEGGGGRGQVQVRDKTDIVLLQLEKARRRVEAHSAKGWVEV
jgi:hypothetical protein